MLDDGLSVQSRSTEQASDLSMALVLCKITLSTTFSSGFPHPAALPSPNGRGARGEGNPAQNTRKRNEWSNAQHGVE
jgi:hypothetical protein